MPDEEKRDDNLHELDKEPATGSLDNPSSSNDDTEQRASSAWGGNNHTELEKDDAANSLDTDVKSGEPRDHTFPISPLHGDIAPATIPMSTRQNTATPNESAELVANEELPKPGPGLMVLQWLTYAFWGWTVLSLSGLVLVVVTQLLGQGSTDWVGGIAYLLAAVIVLFIISLVTDLFYAKAEKKHARSSGTNVIMIIHAVIFALFAIGSLIASVFGLVSLLINDTSGSTGPLTTIISGCIIAVLYGLTLLRTLRPRWIKSVVATYWILMTLTTIIIVALAIIGPAAQARLQNEDKVVEAGAPMIAEAINSYANHQAKLPKSLGDLTSVSSDAQKLIDEHKVTYIPGNKIDTTNKTDYNVNSSIYKSQTAVFHYTLCVDYKTTDGSPDYYTSYRSTGSDNRYPTSISTYGHKAGHICYDLQTDYLYS
jgi:hypothetical protein